jgi:hypothetical protein
MKIKIFHIIFPLVMLFIDVNQVAIPYMIFVFGYMIYLLKNKQFNEVILGLTIFGFSFGLFLNIYIPIPNLMILLLLMTSVFIYRILTEYYPFKKLQLKGFILNSLYFVFMIMILVSLFDIFSIEYPFFKLQLLVIWSFILLFSINSIDEAIDNFNFETFLIISSLLFIPHFSNIEIDGITSSPKFVWDTYSVLDDGIRGTYDVISATRIAGIGILAFIIYLLDFSIKKAHLLGYFLFFIIMLVICQTRQSIAALFLPAFLFFVYSFMRNKKNYLGLFSGLVFLFYSVISYLQYTESKGVESRLVTTVEGSGDEGTGRENIWNSAFEYINKNEGTTGFGNFKHFAHKHNYPHNIFLEVYIEIGALATFILIFILIYILIELYKVFFEYKNNTKIELFLIFSTLYYIGLAQFSVDLPRNLYFLYTFALFVFIKYNKSIKNVEILNSKF